MTPTARTEPSRNASRRGFERVVGAEGVVSDEVDLLEGDEGPYPERSARDGAAGVAETVAGAVFPTSERG